MDTYIRCFPFEMWQNLKSIFMFFEANRKLNKIQQPESGLYIFRFLEIKKAKRKKNIEPQQPPPNTLTLCTLRIRTLIVTDFKKQKHVFLFENMFSFGFHSFARNITIFV